MQCPVAPASAAVAPVFLAAAFPAAVFLQVRRDLVAPVPAALARFEVGCWREAGLQAESDSALAAVRHTLRQRIRNAESQQESC